MAQTHRKFGQQKPGAGIEYTLFTATFTNMVTSLFACNTGATPATFSVHHVPSGGSAGSDNALYYNLELPPFETFLSNSVPIFESGDFMVVVSDSGEVTFTASGMEIS